jgi:hypothetical protein
MKSYWHRPVRTPLWAQVVKIGFFAGISVIALRGVPELIRYVKHARM